MEILTRAFERGPETILKSENSFELGELISDVKRFHYLDWMDFCRVQFE